VKIIRRDENELWILRAQKEGKKEKEEVKNNLNLCKGVGVWRHKNEVS